MPNKQALRMFALRCVRKVVFIANRFVGPFSHRLDKRVRTLNRAITNSSDGVLSPRGLFYEDHRQLTPIYPALPTLGQKPAVTVLCFLHRDGFFGGVATLLLVAGALARELDYDLRIVQTANYEPEAEVLEFLADNGIEIDRARFSMLDMTERTWYGGPSMPFCADDVVLVSAWWDAHIAAQLPLQRPFVYLIQDFEPIFYNNSDEQVLALATYEGKGFVPLFNTSVLREFFVARGYGSFAADGVYFEPACGVGGGEGETPGLVRRQGEKRRLFLYGRPTVERNLYYSALLAIDRALGDARLAGGEWEVFSAGNDGLDEVVLDCGVPVVNLGKMPLDEYYAFARTVDVAVSPMLAPHPNYPTLEFASLGATVVTTMWESKRDLSRYSRNILMCEPSVEALAEGIVAAALQDAGLTAEQWRQGCIGGSWVEALAGPVAEVARRL